MNLVLDDAEEVHMKTKNRKPLGNRFGTCFINTVLTIFLIPFKMCLIMLMNNCYTDDNSLSFIVMYVMCCSGL